MPTDFEQLVRASLEARAQDVQPDPGTWERVQARIRRRERLRWALAGVAVAAVAAVATLAVPALLEQRRVDLRPADDPQPTVSPTTAVTPEAASGCGSGPQTAVVFSTHGNLSALCVDGQVLGLTEGPDEDYGPAVVPDGSAVVFERHDYESEAVSLVYRDLETGEEQIVAGGLHPTFAPDGQIAFVQHEPGQQPRLVAAALFSEPHYEAPVGTPDEPERDVVGVAWDRNGRWLYVLSTTVADPERNGHTVQVFDTHADPDARPMTLTADGEGAEFAAVATGQAAGAPTLIHRCCRTAPGEAFTEGSLGQWVVEPGEPIFRGQFDPLVALRDFPGADVALHAPGLFTAAAGRVWVEPAGDVALRWRHADAWAWLVGDGALLWLVSEDGDVIDLQGEVHSAGFNPAAGMTADPRSKTTPAEAVEPTTQASPSPSPSETLPAQTGLPDAVAATREAIWRAAHAGDVDRLVELAGEEFVYSFGGSDDVRGFFEQQQQEGGLEHLARVLELSYGTQEPEGMAPIYAWPRAFTRDSPEEWTEEDLRELRSIATEEEIEQWREFGGYIGWRVGINADGSWRYYVAGD